MVDDQEAIAQLKHGDITDLEGLFRNYQLQAVRAADFVVRDPALAQDIVQSAFLRAYERIDQFQDEKPLGPLVPAHGGQRGHPGGQAATALGLLRKQWHRS